jgi:hypothetical protein
MDLMAFPMEVLIHIVMFIGDGSELSNLPFIKRNTIRNAINKRLTLVSPKTLCILSRVNKAFRTEFTSNVYWGPLMARDRIQRVFGETSVNLLLIAFLIVLRLMNGRFDSSEPSPINITMWIKTSIGKAMRSIMVSVSFSNLNSFLSRYQILLKEKINLNMINQIFYKI